MARQRGPVHGPPEGVALLYRTALLAPLAHRRVRLGSCTPGCMAAALATEAAMGAHDGGWVDGVRVGSARLEAAGLCASCTGAGGVGVCLWMWV